MPEIKLEIPAVPKISVICEIRPKLFEIRFGNLEIRFGNLEIRREIPAILEIRQISGIWPETLQVRPEVPKIWP